MSAFLPFDPSAGQQQKRMLLERLMQQHMQNAARYAGASGAGGQVAAPAVGGTPFRSAHHFGGLGLVTQHPGNVPADLLSALGPGAMPRGGPPPGLTGYVNPAGLGHSAMLAPYGLSNPMPTAASFGIPGAFNESLPPGLSGNPGLPGNPMFNPATGAMPVAPGTRRASGY